MTQMDMSYSEHESHCTTGNPTAVIGPRPASSLLSGGNRIDCPTIDKPLEIFSFLGFICRRRTLTIHLPYDMIESS